MFGLSLREKIIAADDQPLVKVEVPEWDATVYVKPFNGQQVDQWEIDTDEARNSDDKSKLIGVRALLLSLTLVDEKGVLLFTKDDIEALQKKNGKIIKRLFAVAQDANGLTLANVEAEKKT